MHIKNRKSAGVFSILLFGIFSLAAQTRLDTPSVIKLGFPSIPSIYQISDSGRREGYFYDLEQILGKKNGWTLEYVEASWEKCLTMLHSGEIDLLGFVPKQSFGDWLFDYNRERIVSIYATILVQRDSKYKEISDLHGMRIAMLSGRGETAELLHILYSANLTAIPQYFEDSNAQIEAFRNKQAEAILLPSHLMTHVLKQGKFEETGIVLSPRDYGFAVKADKNGDLLDILDRSLADLKQKSPKEIEGLKKMYLDPPRKYHIPLWMIVLLVSLSAAAVLVLAFNIALRSQVSKHTQELTRQKEELERIGHEKDRINQELESFSYSVSHDLRAPLRAIDGYSTILLAQHSSCLDLEARHSLERILGNTKKMGDLISSLLELSRLGKVSLRLEQIDMTEMALAVINEVETPEIRLGFKIRADSLPTAYADRILIRQVWFNLISNAFKYSSKSDIKSIEITGEEEKGFTRYTIKDQGAGFEPEYSEKLFNIFQRLHGQGDFPGIGVGLVTVKRIIERHGGKVWALGSPGKGASFSFSLPEKPGHVEN